MELFNLLWKLILALINPVFLVPIAIVIVVLVWKDREYKRTTYYKITKCPYYAMRYNKGRYGEFLLYKALKAFENYGARFLFNVYIPKSNGQTTEIDVLMICSQGIFVFENKNYSGWIFGSGNQRNWYQTLPAGRKSHKEMFYNPIMQNRSHINHLQKYLGDHFPAYSLIVFSDHCELRNVQFDPKEAIVTKRWNIQATINAICEQVSPGIISESKIDEIYNKLYPLTQVDASVKMQHIEAIHHNLMPHVTPPPPQNIAPSTVAAEEGNNVTVVPPDSSEDHTEIVASTLPPEHTIEPENIDSVAVDSQPSVCPCCGGKLVMRTATRGANAGNKFYGCSNYPQCKYIKNDESKTV